MVIASSYASATWPPTRPTRSRKCKDVPTRLHATTER